MTTLVAVPQKPTRPGVGGIDTIVLPQRFDVHEIPRFELMVAGAVAAGGVLKIDASEVRHLDRSAIDCLIATRLRCMDHGGDLTLVAASVAARVILELSGRYEALNPIDGTDRQEEADFDEAAA
ncbi:MAG: anti-sigma factor antagonist [Actinomycetota bacterium]|nr:anti-sigma factor antagonist [Actinomycetota bacterium]